MPALCSSESARGAERQLQQACGNSAANVKAKGCFHRKDQVYSHTCFPCTQLSDRRCFVVGSRKAATCQKPQQDSMPAYFYCCTCWHVTTPHNGISLHAEAPEWCYLMQDCTARQTLCLQRQPQSACWSWSGTVAQPLLRWSPLESQWHHRE